LGRREGEGIRRQESGGRNQEVGIRRQESEGRNNAPILYIQESAGDRPEKPRGYFTLQQEAI
jgi:hypothetical protein